MTTFDVDDCFNPNGCVFQKTHRALFEEAQSYNNPLWPVCSLYFVLPGCPQEAFVVGWVGSLCSATPGQRGGRAAMPSSLSPVSPHTGTLLPGPEPPLTRNHLRRVSLHV